MKIIGVGWNYPSHLSETDAKRPEEPIIFLKPSTALIGNGEAIVLPEVGRVDHEVELAVVIGKGGKGITAADSLAHIAGLAVFNDVTARDLQDVARKKGDPWDLCKGMDTFAPMSEPVPLCETIDVQDLDLELRVNGVLKQKGNTSQMFFGVRELIAYISMYMTLESGDVIATGTPEGISPLRKGDVVQARIDGVGELLNPVI